MAHKNIAIGLFILIAFLTLTLVSPQALTDRLFDWFNIRYPELPPTRVSTGQQELADTIRDRISPADIESRLRRLSASGSRVVGYPGHRAASLYIQDEFKHVGLENVSVETYDVTSPVDKGGGLRIVGEPGIIPIHAVWPNLVRTSTLPGAGLRAPLIDAGAGEFVDFNGKEPGGSVVLMDFNSWNRWMNAPMLGARAIVFIAPDSTTTAEAEQKFFQVPLNAPRFWIGKSEGERLRRRLADGERMEVELTARMDWETHPTQNIIGWITGTDPQLRERVVLIDAYYDAMSAVPALAPGAEQASGIVALLEMAEYFKAHPPAHTILFLATSAHHLGFRGVCDFLRRHARKEEHFVALMTDPIDIRLWISLDLSSQSDQMAVWNGSTAFYYQRFFTPLGKRFTSLGADLAPAFGMDAKRSLVDGINPPSGMSWSMFIPGGNIKTDSQVVLTAGMPTLAFVTINDARFRVDTPFDTVEQLNLTNLTNQIRLLTAVLSRALDEPTFLPDYRVKMKDRMRALRGRLLTYPRRSITPDRPRKGAVAVLRMSHEKSVKGVRAIFYDQADENGEFYIPGLAVRWVGLDAYHLDPESGEITYASDRGQAARIYKPEFGMDWWVTRATRIMFPCVSTDFYETVDPRYLTKLTNLTIYGDGNTAPQEYGYTLGYGPNEPVGVVFTRPGVKLKLTMQSRGIGIRYLLLNATDTTSVEAARKSGFVASTHGAITHTAYQAAKDMWILDHARMRELHEYGIENDRLTDLHDRAREHLDQADAARQQLRWDDFVRHSRAALGLESRAYPDVKGTQNDVIRGIIFFMALVLPCAFFGERLIFTAVDIRWQIAGSAGIFLVIWIFLWVVHPAFDLSNPFVILLAFVLLCLATFVISLVFSRFNSQMRNLRTEAAIIHDVDVGRISASLAAFHLGIANMKKRKLRTLLTFSTLVLLTFTVLSFTSIKSQLSYHQIKRNNLGQYPGMLIRSKYWAPLEESVLDYAHANFGREAVVAARSWYASKEKKAIQVVSDSASANALGIVGLTSEETEVIGIQSCLSAGRWFRPGERNVAVLPEAMAKLLKISESDVGHTQVRLFGEHFTVVGLINAERMKDLDDLDGEPLTPADFVLTDENVFMQMAQQEKREKAGLEQTDVEIMEFEHLDPANVMVVPYQTLREVSSPLQAIAIRFRDPTVVEQRVVDFISRLSVVLFAGIPEVSPEGKIGRISVSVYSSFGHASPQGLSNLFIPIAIAALIVLNTMMGSVYERFREIGIYSSVGLAPVHIAFLFLAESCVYAVLGAVSGYLLAQGVSKVLLWQGLLQGITVNYSSVSAMASSTLVMLVVILSTVYPARRASQLAVPDITRRWKLPEPDADRWHFEFPFTISGNEVLGLFTFLTRYFDFHTESSMGNFFTHGADLSTHDAESGRGYRIETTIWLAPFDLGVSQTIRLASMPTGNFDIHALEITIDRLSGDVSSWKRCNQRFVNQVRKQFLIWRTIPEESKRQYGTEGSELIEQGQASALQPTEENV